MNAQTGIINIRGKEYKSVALRVQEFREDHPDWALTAEVVARDQDCVVMKAVVSDEAGRIRATGHAEEYRASSQINKTSALENAETSAIGRALAAAGYGGTEFASANEVVNAIHQQADGNAAARGQSQQGAVSPAAAMPDAEYTRLVQLVEATNTNIPTMFSALGIKRDKLRDLDMAEYEKALAALNAKLAKMATAETNAKAKETV